MKIKMLWLTRPDEQVTYKHLFISSEMAKKKKKMRTAIAIRLKICNN